MMRIFLLLIAMMSSIALAQGSRPLETLVDIQGVRNNQLVGYGLVVGLDGTGDRNQVEFTGRSVGNMLEQFGIQLDGDGRVKTKNVAAVMITAKMSVSTGVGQTIDVVVSSLGDAESLRGGTLLMTPLLGADGMTYALAQGSVVVAGLSATGSNGSSVTVNTPTGGSIPGGAIVEREISVNQAALEQPLVMHLRSPSFAMATQVARQINETFGAGTARPLNNSRIEVSAPSDASQRTGYIALLSQISIDSVAQPARIIFNSRTGTVVISQNVRVREAAVSHGNLSVRITETQNVSQPNEFGQGDTVTTTDSIVEVSQADGSLNIIGSSTSLSQVVEALNGLGASPDDLMTILHSLQAVGAIDAELIVI